jgi:hypothetical protein
MGGDAKAWKAANPERAKEHSRRYAKKHSPRIVERVKQWLEAHPEARLCYSAKHRARLYGVPFALKPSDIVIPEVCPVLGIRLTVNGPRRDSTASLDRIVPELGYVPGNVAVVSWRANLLKNNGTADEHQRIAAWMREVVHG